MKSNWNNYSLEQLVEFKNGKSSPIREDGLFFPVYGANGVIGFSSDFNTEKDSVIVGRVGSYCGSVYYSDRSCWVTDNALIGKAKSNSDSKFLYYLLLNLNLNHHRSGSGQPLLNQSILNAINVCVPDKPNQQRIAQILSSIDNKIECIHQMNQTLEQIIQMVFKHWFIDFEFLNDSNRPYKSSGGDIVASELGLVPKGWKIQSLEEVAKIVNGFAFKSEDFLKEGLLMVRSQNIDENGTINNQNPIYLDENKKSYHQEQILEEYDYLMVMVGASLGKQGIVRKHNLPAILNQNMWNIRPIKLSRHFFNHSLHNNLHRYLSFASGSARDFVRKSDYYKLNLLIPPQVIMNKFESMASGLEDKISNNLLEYQILTMLRDSLLPKLIAGTIKV